MATPNPTASFLCSAGKAAEFPSGVPPELCILGRSNVGKSSFINHVLSSRNLARVSKTPGKTILANFYQLSDGWRWVDLPGYGYARASRSEQRRLSSLIRAYCEERDVLRGAIWLLDVRHPGLSADREAFAWLTATGLPILAVLTKCDKVSGGRVNELRRKHAALYPGVAGFVAYSTLRPGSRQAFWGAYAAWLQERGA
ncbi:MAG: ribosome biogenesis GTP-binding protein YsxC [Chitinivibrionales bacterium]|nr:ribosome biogenesis GTP-binding protein YsxC [Chitinivibrionales bacterium]